MRHPLSAVAAIAAPTGARMSESTRTVSEGEYTRFERARILGARALQVSLGAPILIDVPTELIDPVEIAEREFREGAIPITVRRGTAAS